MNNTIVYLGLVLAKPLLSLITRKMGLFASDSAKKVPYFKLLHELPGRSRYQSELLKDPAFSQNFQQKFMSFPGITSVKINYITGSILLTYSIDNTQLRQIFAKLNQDLQLANQKKVPTLSELAEKFISTEGTTPQGGSKGKGSGGAGGRSSALFPHTDQAPASGGALLPFNSSDRSGSLPVISRMTDSVQQLSGRNLQGSSLRDLFFNNMAQVSNHINSKTQGYFDLPSLFGSVLICRGLYKMFRYGQMPSGPQLIWWGYSFFKIRGKYVGSLPFNSTNTK